MREQEITYNDFQEIFKYYNHWEEYLRNNREQFTDTEVLIIELFRIYSSGEPAKAKLKITDNDIIQAIGKLKVGLPKYYEWLKEYQMKAN